MQIFGVSTMGSTSMNGFADEIAEALPYLRRYARALTGGQTAGDSYAAATLEALLADEETARSAATPAIGLFSAFHKIWTSSGSPVEGAERDGSPEAGAQWRMSGLTAKTREVLLLHSIEGFSQTEIAEIVDVTPEEVAELLSIAREELKDSVAGRVLVIEDEGIIAADITAIVESMGHTSVGTARTRDAAVELARRDPPDLILADIQLADKSSGIDAVNHILRETGDMPVVFITAFPERLLTGERPEPAFLIAKPYTEEQVRSAVSQAMFFRSTATLKA